MLTSEAVDSLRRSFAALEAVVADRLARRRGDLLELDVDRDGAGEPPAIPGLDCYLEPGPLADLISSCDLDAVDALVVVGALAPSVDGRFRRWYRQLDRSAIAGGLTVEAARILAAGNFGAQLAITERLRPNSSLVAMGVVELVDRGDGVEVVVTEHVHDFLLGFPPTPPDLSSTFPAVPLRTVHDRASLVVRNDVGQLLDEVGHRIRFEHRVIDEWALGDHLDHARGLVALFHGPSGTGKTLAAAVVAKSAGVDAYRVDMQACVSKYIGETEKNLELVFRRAEAEGCILFFDEADAFFGKRTEVHDAHDRYANHDISFLLQRLEQHPGVVILATNLPAALDDAFERRIDVKIEFVPPGRAERLELWKRALPDALPVDGDIDVDELARRYELTGGEIRNAILNGAYRAAAAGTAVGHAHLVQGVATQYAKAGRMMPAGGGTDGRAKPRR